MYKISIVLDTNVLILSLEKIRAIFVTEFPVIWTLNFPRIVLQELDNLKSKNKKARDAIKFIQSVSTSLNIEIEGNYDDRKMQIDLGFCVESIYEHNNDDKIINYAAKLENPILITDDAALSLKCKSFNIKTVSALNLSAAALYENILAAFNLIVLQEPKVDLFNELVSSMASVLVPRIHQILFKELGEPYALLLKDLKDLSCYLKFVNRNFFLFKSYVPKKVNKFINMFLQDMKTSNFESGKKNGEAILVSFGCL